MKEKRSMLQRHGFQEKFFGYLFILPNFLAVLLFVVGPIIYSLYMSFTNWDLLTPPKFIGLNNYTDYMVYDDQFWLSVKNTVIFTLLSVPLGIVIALLFAVILNSKIKGVAFYRGAIFLPTILSMVSISMVWRWMLNKEYGVFNYFTSFFGIEGVGWLTNDTYAIFAVSMIAIWKGLGFNMVILLAGLQDVPKELYEAAIIDGSNPVQKFFKITLPLITPSLFFVGVMAVINSFQVFDLVYMTTQEFTTKLSRVPVIYYYLWKNAFVFFKMGYASALSWVVFIFLLGITLIQVKVLGKKINYELG